MISIKKYFDHLNSTTIYRVYNNNILTLEAGFRLIISTEAMKYHLGEVSRHFMYNYYVLIKLYFAMYI